jgi:hypothetical protein
MVRFARDAKSFECAPRAAQGCFGGGNAAEATWGAAAQSTARIVNVAVQAVTRIEAILRAGNRGQGTGKQRNVYRSCCKDLFGRM